MNQLFIFVLVVLASSQWSCGQKCCIPDQMEGYLSFASLTSDGFSEGVGAYAYDYTNLQQAWLYSTQDRLLKEITTQGKRYIINLLNSTCIVLRADPVTRKCVPDSAIKVRNQYVGIGKDNVTAVTYKYNSYILTVTKKNCVFTQVQDRGTHRLETYDFYNVTFGINDPAIFTPPPFCNQSLATSRTDEFVHKRYVPIMDHFE